MPVSVCHSFVCVCVCGRGEITVVESVWFLKGWEHLGAFFQAWNLGPRCWKVWQFDENGRQMLCRKEIQKKKVKWVNKGKC